MMEPDHPTYKVNSAATALLKRWVGRLAHLFVLLYAGLGGTVLTAFYTLYFRAALLFGYDQSGTAVLGFTRESSAHMRFVDNSVGLLIYLFPVYVLAHALAFFCRGIRLETSVIVISLLLFVAYCCFVSSTAEWYFD